MRTDECTPACCAMPECTTCHKTKKPRGRDAPLSSNYCDSDCDGYWQEPLSGHLWPSEMQDARLPRR